MKHLKSAVARLATSPSITNGYNKAAVACFALAFVCQDVMAADGASTKSTLVNVFNWIYGLGGVFAGITLLVQFINAKAGNFLGTQDPRKAIINTLIYTACFFGVVAIIQAIKFWMGGAGGDISTL